MWQGQQPPGGEQNPQAQNNPYQQPGYQQPNPYQQPGYQQPNPYAQQQGWGAPTQVTGPQAGSGGGKGGGGRTKVVAIVAASAVVLTAAVTGFLVLGGGDKKDQADGGSSPAPSASADPSAAASASAAGDDRNGESEKPTIAGWKVVVNPKWGTAFDVPPDWEVQAPGIAQGYEWEDKTKSSGYDQVLMTATADLKPKWCSEDDDKDGKTDDHRLGVVGTKGASGAKSADEVAINTPAWWVFGGYTEPDKKSITFDKKGTPYTTTAGIAGSYGWARSSNSPKTGKCASDGKAITFGFKNSKGDFVSWILCTAKGVKDEVPDATIMKILSTVRLHGEPTEG